MLPKLPIAEDRFYKIRFTRVLCAASGQLADNQTDSCCKVFRDTPAVFCAGGASLKMKNPFEVRALRVTERCVFCPNLLRQLSKLAG